MTEIKEIKKNIWEIPQKGKMKVPGRIYATTKIINSLLEEERKGNPWNALEQVKNVACLPGIIEASYAMSDIHPGYGFPIGGVAGFNLEEGVISVAGVGFDCNCGVRTLTTSLTYDETKNKLKNLAEALFSQIPAGLGSTGSYQLKVEELEKLLIEGSSFLIKKGYGLEEDLLYTEERGQIKGAKPSNVSLNAKRRQLKQIGTLGSGNHYLEVQKVEQIFLEQVAKAYGLFPNQIIVSIHCGSRALGHQIGSDYLKELATATKKYNIPLFDKELVCAPIKSPEGEKYFSALKCAINAAFANRQMLTFLTRKVFAEQIGINEEEIKTLYDIGHNNAKMEEHEVDGKKKKLLVLRKGSTRAFGPNKKELPPQYRPWGQPVLVGGTMGTNSYILHGTETAMKLSWGSACHGAGRVMSRNKAKKKWHGKTLQKILNEQGVIVKGHSKSGLAEEAPGAYKDIEEVLEAMTNLKIVGKVAKLKPLISIKG